MNRESTPAGHLVPSLFPTVIWPTEDAILPPGHPDAPPVPKLAAPLPAGTTWGTAADGSRIPVYPDPVPAPVVPQPTGLSRGERKTIIVTACGSFTLLSVGGVFVLVTNAVADLEPVMPDLIEMLKWGVFGIAALAGVIVALVVGLHRKGGGPLIHKEQHTYTTTSSGWFARSSNTVHHGDRTLS